MDFGISGSSAPTTNQRATTASSRAAPQVFAAPPASLRPRALRSCGPRLLLLHALGKTRCLRLRACGAACLADEQKRAAPASPGVADEIPMGSGLPSGLSDVELENICRLQYARWASEQEYVASVGAPPDRWPDSGLYKSTKKKGDDCKFYWKKVPEWRHMWGKASSAMK